MYGDFRGGRILLSGYCILLKYRALRLRPWVLSLTVVLKYEPSNVHTYQPLQGTNREISSILAGQYICITENRDISTFGTLSRDTTFNIYA